MKTPINPKIEILALRAEFIADHIRQMVSDTEKENGTPLADDLFMSAVECTVRLALYELGE